MASIAIHNLYLSTLVAGGQEVPAAVRPENFEVAVTVLGCFGFSLVLCHRPGFVARVHVIQGHDLRYFLCVDSDAQCNGTALHISSP